MKHMAFQEFTNKGGKYTPQIIINKAGYITLSSGMHHRFSLDKFNSVKVYYDPETKRVGLKLIESKEGTFLLKKRENEKGAYFAAKSFLLANSLDPKKFYGRYEPQEVEDENIGKIFVITVKERI